MVIDRLWNSTKIDIVFTMMSSYMTIKFILNLFGLGIVCLPKYLTVTRTTINGDVKLVKSGAIVILIKWRPDSQ